MPDPKSAPFQPGDKCVLIPTGHNVVVVYQYENEDQTGWGNVRVKDEKGDFICHNWQLTRSTGSDFC